MSKDQHTPENLPLHQELVDKLSHEDVNPLRELMTAPKENLTPSEVEQILSVFTKAYDQFDEDLFEEPLAYLCASRRGLRVQDLKTLMGEDFDVEAFLNLTSCFGVPFVGLTNGIVFIGSPQLKYMLFDQYSQADQISYHKDIAHYLLKLPAQDPVRMAEMLYHMLQAQMVNEAATYYANLVDASLPAASDLMGGCFASGKGGEEIINAVLKVQLPSRYMLYAHFVNDVFVSLMRHAGLDKALALVRMIEKELTGVMGEKNTIDDILLLGQTGLRLASIYVQKKNMEEVKRYFDSSLRFLDSLMAQNPPLEAFAWHHIDAISNYAMICLEMNQAQAALHCLEIAVKLLDEKVAAEPTPNERLIYQSTWYFTVIRVLAQTKQKEQMLTYYKRGKKPIEDTLAFKMDFVANNPENDAAKRDVMAMYNDFADLAHLCEDKETAEVNFAKALELAEGMAVAHVDKIEYLVAPTITFDRMGKMYAELGEMEPAKTYFSKSLELRKELDQKFPGDIRLMYDLAAAYHNMAGVYVAQEDKTPAEPFLVDQVETVKRALEIQPNNEHGVRTALESMITLSDFYMAHDKAQQAADVLLGVHPILKPILGGQVSEHILNVVAGVHYKMAMAEIKLEKVEESKKNMKTAADLWRQLFDTTKNPVYKNQLQKANEHLGN